MPRKEREQCGEETIEDHCCTESARSTASRPIKPDPLAR
jgi:hypothetical protein